MALDPRMFTVKNCPKSANQSIKEDTSKRDFFDDIGKVGDIEVLNRFGASKITKGMRDLAKVSDQIRTGETDSAIIPNSAGYVFETVGINPNAAEQAGEFNPGVLNRATGQAEGIIDSVRQGRFGVDDIPGSVAEIQNLDTLVNGIFTEEADTSLKDIAKCGASPYAIDLIQHAPKYKFMFVVEIKLSPSYEPEFGQNERTIAFLVKNSTRPNVSIEHEEVNMYNFWTRIPKRTVFEPITMRFHDDTKGNAHQFYNAYLRNISPITRTGGFDQAGLLSAHWLEANSMNSSIKNENSTASVGALIGKNTSIITEIRLFHIINYGRKMTAYHFHHPKILSMNLDELDMTASSSGSEIELQFAYDAMHITPTVSLKDSPNDVTKLSEQGGGLYPIVPVFEPTPNANGQVDDGDYDDEDDDNGFGIPDDDENFPTQSSYNNDGGVTGPIQPQARPSNVVMNRDLGPNATQPSSTTSAFGKTVTREESFTSIDLA